MVESLKVISTADKFFTTCESVKNTQAQQLITREVLLLIEHTDY